MLKKIKDWTTDCKEYIEVYGFLKGIAKSLPFNIYNRYSRVKYWIRHRTIDKYHIVKTNLPPNYYDVDELMIHVNFALLERYVIDEHENGLEDILRQMLELSNEEFRATNPDEKESLKNTVHYLKEVMDLYLWWKNTYPFYKQNDPLEKSIDKNEKLNINETIAYHKEINNTIETNLIRLMKIRLSLWT